MRWKKTMTEEITPEQYEAQIAELTAQLKEAQSKGDTFDELKQKYEKIIEEKNTEITELQKKNDDTQAQVDDAVGNLQDEAQALLDANEEYQNALATIKELELERAEATVDAYIKKGVLLPSQRDAALKLCINDNDTFLNLYKDAKPIVEIQETRKSIPAGTADRIAKYFKK